MQGKLSENCTMNGCQPCILNVIMFIFLFSLFQLKVLLGWCTAFACGLAVVYGVRKEFRKHSETFTRAENLFYGTFSRFVWGIALAWVIYACHFGYGGTRFHPNFHRVIR